MCPGHTSFLLPRPGLFRDIWVVESRRQAHQVTPEGAYLAGSPSPLAYCMGLGPGDLALWNCNVSFPSVESVMVVRIRYKLPAYTNA